jgi:cation diffusion facilitator family transporter
LRHRVKASLAGLALGSDWLLVPRHSRAALRAAANRDSQRNILIALVANVAVAGAKLAAGLITGSSALLAEAAHSAADSVNEVMLGVSLRRSRRAADEAHPFGYGGTRFLWAFLAAIFSFLIGGCVSIALAIHELQTPPEVGRFLIGWIVLGVAFLADGISLVASLATTRREAALWDLSIVGFIRRTSDPTLRALVVEDTAALIGVGLAAAGLFLHQVLGWTDADAIASLLIGLLLAATAVGLAGPAGATRDRPRHHRGVTKRRRSAERLRRSHRPSGSGRRRQGSPAGRPDVRAACACVRRHRPVAASEPSRGSRGLPRSDVVLAGGRGGWSTSRAGLNRRAT